MIEVTEIDIDFLFYIPPDWCTTIKIMSIFTNNRESYIKPQ